jgi:hypothetical protein
MENSGASRRCRSHIIRKCRGLLYRETIVLLYDLSNLMPGLVGNRQLLTTLCPSGCQNPAPIGSCHPFTETVLILSFSP